MKEFVNWTKYEGNLVDIAADTMQLRMHKSDEEIELITQGARIADVGGAACVEALVEKKFRKKNSLLS